MNFQKKSFPNFHIIFVKTIFIIFLVNRSKIVDDIDNFATNYTIGATNLMKQYRTHIIYGQAS